MNSHTLPEAPNSFFLMTHTFRMTERKTNMIVGNIKGALTHFTPFTFNHILSSSISKERRTMMENRHAVVVGETFTRCQRCLKSLQYVAVIR